MRRAVPLLVLAATLLAGAASAFAAQAQPAADPQPTGVLRPAEVQFTGKLYTPVKFSVPLPFPAFIQQIGVQIGQQVKVGQELARYELRQEVYMDEKNKLSTTTIKELEYRLAQVDVELDKLTAKHRELEVMTKRNMASQQSISQNEKEIEAARKEKTSIQEQLNLARDVYSDRLILAKERFGRDAGAGNVPKVGFLRSPLDGYVLWINAEARSGAHLERETPIFQVGVLDPMIIRAQVHEIEVNKIAEGNAATVVFDAIPGREFAATVSRIPWTPLPANLQQPSYYEIELTIPNPDHSLREGLKGQVTVIPSK
ncbi:multidrug resistance efflux pump-like [hydrocarbon metagenome]|uniref:Multidrug resistance efflux pump-like n=1 Tax=hydrocarbon metagenome TaxID=938273 RepID=A0A0W8G4F3_9ZZZZ